jgi:hypothetical protein
LSEPRKLKSVSSPHALRRMAQEKLAGALEVDLKALRTKMEPEPVRPRSVYRRVHRTYLKILLEREVG